MDLTENKRPYGGFATEIDHKGSDKSLHIPFGRCLEWADGGWIRDDLYR
jgi:hypothetical protein